jgi:organic radical activating enzyme
MPKRYTVKKIFYTLQGEGVHAGRPAVFCRFSGCNLWSGQEEDREAAICKFCDTDFLGGEKYDLETLVGAIAAEWPATKGHPMPYIDPNLPMDERLFPSVHGR